MERRIEKKKKKGFPLLAQLGRSTVAPSCFGQRKNTKVAVRFGTSEAQPNRDYCLRLSAFALGSVSVYQHQPTALRHFGVECNQGFFCIRNSAIAVFETGSIVQLAHVLGSRASDLVTFAEPWTVSTAGQECTLLCKPLKLNPSPPKLGPFKSFFAWSAPRNALAMSRLTP